MPAFLTHIFKMQKKVLAGISALLFLVQWFQAQQPSPNTLPSYEISVVHKSSHTAELTLSVFPGPSSADLRLRAADWQKLGLTYRLYDAKGRTLSEQRLSSTETIIGSSGLSSAVYFLELSGGTQILTVFQIIKRG